VARDAGARLLVLSHFSQRYPDTRVLLDEAVDIFDHVVAAEDLLRVPVPARRSASDPAQRGCGPGGERSGR
jgi:ribonuclease Z